MAFIFCCSMFPVIPVFINSNPNNTHIIHLLAVASLVPELNVHQS